MKNLFLVVLLFVIGKVQSQEEEALKVLSYQVDSISVLTDSGELIKTISVSKLPKPEVVVKQYNEELDLIMIKDNEGNEIWLDTFDVELNKGKVVNLPCAIVAMNNVHDKAQKGTQGFGPGCK